MCDEVLIDWLELTWKLEIERDVSDCLDKIRFISEWFGGLDSSKDVEITPRPGFRGYKTGGTFLTGLARFAFNLDNLRQGFHVCFPGQALAFLGNRSFFDVISFLSDVVSFSPDGVLEPHTNISRCDIALDDYSRKLSLRKIERLLFLKFKRNESTLTTRFRCKPDEYKTIGDRGHTIYLGNKDGKTRFRFYNKAAERKVLGHWIRCEGQFRDKQACNLVQSIIAHGLDCIRSVFLSYIDFKDVLSLAERVQDKSTASWWSDFLGVSEKIKLSVGKEVKTFEQVCSWVDKQVAPTLSMLHQAGFDMNSISESAEDRLKSSHFDLLSRFELIKTAVSLGGSLVHNSKFEFPGWRRFEQKQQSRRALKSIERQDVLRRLQDNGHYKVYPDGKERIIHISNGSWSLGGV